MSRMSRIWRCLFGVLLLAALAVSLAASAHASRGVSSSPRTAVAAGAQSEALLPNDDSHLYVWKGPDGEPLPIQTDEEILDFLRTATPVSLDWVGRGITDPQIIVLDKDGVRARAIFHAHDLTHQRVRLSDGSYYVQLRDSSYAQCAGYVMARMLGLNNVPPTVMRWIRGKTGSLQIWVEDSFTDKERMEERIQPPDLSRFRKRGANMKVFDALIGNVDRNAGNIIYDPGDLQVLDDRPYAWLPGDTATDRARQHRTDRAGFVGASSGARRGRSEGGDERIARVGRD